MNVQVKQMMTWLPRWAAGLLLAGCASFPVQDERARAEDIAVRGGLTRMLIDAPPFLLTAYVRLQRPGGPLAVYVEGDGAAWLSRTRLSSDPTPARPVALELAARDPGENVLYLARPCQYTLHALDTSCRPEYWSGKRYAEEVVAATNGAITRIQQRIQAPELHLVGYSGGAALAVLVAARRTDVASLRSVAGNLDPTLLNRMHGVSPLSGSLDPTVHARALARIPQRHWVGQADKVVSPAIARAWVDHSGSSRCIDIVSLPGLDHGHGWAERWADSAGQAVACDD